MTNIRPKDLPAGSRPNSDDFALVDGVVGGTRKLPLYGDILPPGYFVAKIAFSPAPNERVVRLSDFDNTTDLVPKVSLALATQGYVKTDPLALYISKLGGGGASSGDLVLCMRAGTITTGVIGGGSAGDPVYANDAGKLSTTAGTNKRRVGKILLVATIGDPGSYVVEFDGEYRAETSVETATAPLVITGSDIALSPASQANGDLLTRIAGVWSRLALGVLGYSLLAGATGPAYGVPQAKASSPTTSTYTTDPTDRFVVAAYAGGNMTVTFDNSAPTTGFIRRVTVFYNLSSGALTVKDPGGNTLIVLDGNRMVSADFVSPDGTNWAIEDRGPLNIKQRGVFIGRMAAGVTVGSQGSCCYQTGENSGDPEFSFANPSSGSVASDNPLVLALSTVDGSAASAHNRVFFMTRGLVTGYDVAGSPAVGAAVYVSTSGRMSTTPGTVRRRVGAIIAGSGTSWDVEFDGSFMFGSGLAFGTADANGDIITRASGKYGPLAIGSADGMRLKVSSGLPVWGYLGTATKTGTSYTVTAADEMLFVDTSAGNYTLTMPATVPGAGWRCRIQKKTTDANTITLARGSFTGKIQGVAGDFAWALSSSPGYPWIDIVSDGTDLWVQ